MSNSLKIIIYSLVAIVAIAMIVIVYRIFFEFDNNEVKAYAKDQADKYGDKKAAYNIIIEGVNHILSSHNQTLQVKQIAKASNTSREMELVNAAVNDAISKGYLQRENTVIKKAA